MPVRVSDLRRQEESSLVARRDQLNNALRDHDWIERLTINDDFKRYLARVDEAQSLTIAERDKVVSQLSAPLQSHDQRNSLNEKLIVLTATIDATDAVTGWPKAQEKRLEDARKELPDLEAKIKELGEK